MHSRYTAGWKALVCAVAAFALLIPAAVMAGGRDDGEAIFDSTGGSLQRVRVVTEQATISVDRYPRANYSWPFQVGPHYGRSGIVDVRAPGVLHTQVGSFNLSSGKIDLPAELMTTNKLGEIDSQYFIIQVHPDLIDADSLASMRSSVAALGGEVLQHMPVAAWVARLTPAAYSAVQSTAGLMAIEPLHPGLKLDSGIGRHPLPDPIAAQSENYSLNVSLFKGENSQALAQQIRNLGGHVTSVHYDIVKVELHHSQLVALAGIEGVRMVREDLPITMHAEETTTTVQTGRYNGGAIPYHDAGVDGSGGGIIGASTQVLAMVDSGIQLDNADLSDTDASAGTAGPLHRKVVHYGTTDVFNGQGDALGCDSNAQGGFTHGHLVAAAALGNATDVPVAYGVGQKARDLFNNNWKLDGVAPGAQLAAYDALITPAVVNCGDPNLGVFAPGRIYITNATPALRDGSLWNAYDSFGARVANLSWGESSAYDTFSEDLDSFLFDNVDAVGVVSGGNEAQDANNDGVCDAGSTGSPCNSKNAICVGTSFNANDFNETDNPLTTTNAKPSARSAVSSCGNWDSAVGGLLARVEPNVMAPGVDAGAGMGLDSEFACRSVDNDGTGTVECDVREGITGSSYAAAAVSGGALLTKDWYAQGFYPDGRSDNDDNPLEQLTASGPLVKATLLASAQFLDGINTNVATGEFPFRFNKLQGYGRIQLDQALPLATWPSSVPGIIAADGYNAAPFSDFALDGVDLDGLDGSVGVGQTDAAEFTVCNNEGTLAVMLAWYENLGATLSNDLDLEVESPSGKIYHGNFFTEDLNYDRVLAATEDCPTPWPTGNTPAGATLALDESRWSLPVCVRNGGLGTLPPHDAVNPTEGVFLSSDPDANDVDDDNFNQLELGVWKVRVARGSGTGTQPYSIVAVGQVCNSASTARLDDFEYVCNAKANLTVAEFDDANDPKAGLTPGEIGSRSTLAVTAFNICNDKITSCSVLADCAGVGGGPCNASLVVDTEIGLGFDKIGSCSGDGAKCASTTDCTTPQTCNNANSLKFQLSEAIVLTDGTLPEANNGVLDVRDGNRVALTYADELLGITDNDLTRGSSASVSCKVDVQFGNVNFGSFGQDPTIRWLGGCERNERDLFEFGFPDKYLDAGEFGGLGIGFASTEDTDLVNAKINARCIYADTNSPVTCKPGTGDCADPDRLDNLSCDGTSDRNPLGTQLMTITDTPKVIGRIPPAAVIATNVTVQVVSDAVFNALPLPPAGPGPSPKIEILLEITGETSGKSATGLVVSRQRMNVDEVSLFYSTDFLGGGTEIRDVQNNELAGSTLGIDEPTVNIGDFLVDYVFERRQWSNALNGTNAGGIPVLVNQNLQAPWHFDNNDGGFLSGLNAFSDEGTINDIIANWGEDKNFNGVLDGRCTGAPSQSCTRFPTANSCPIDPNPPFIDVTDITGTGPPDGIADCADGSRCCQNLEDRDPANIPPKLNQNWSTDGGCGWQTQAPNTCVNIGQPQDGLGCYPGTVAEVQAQCGAAGLCNGAGLGTGGIWHTGKIGGLTGACTIVANLPGQCQFFETVSGTTGNRRWDEELLTPVIQKVNQQLDDDGEPVFQAEILDMKLNSAIDLPDNQVGYAWEFDTDAAKIEPADLVSDQTYLNLATGAYGALNGVSNPDLTRGFSLFAPVNQGNLLSRNGTAGGNRSADNGCHWEGAGAIAALALTNAGEDLGLPGPPDDDLNNGFCASNEATPCSYVCDGTPVGLTFPVGCNTLGVGACNGGTCTTGICSNAKDIVCTSNLECNLGSCVDRHPNCETAPLSGIFDICQRSNTTIDEFVAAAGPIRNFDLFAFNGPDMRFSTLEDLFGNTGNTFQGAITFINFEADVTTAPVAGYGHGVDDVVVQWREFRLATDTTDCAVNGRCATLDLKTVNFYEGSALLEITATETTPYGLRCLDSGSCTISGLDCTNDAGCGATGGNCENNGCNGAGAGDCHVGALDLCQASFNDCDGNNHFFDAGDDDDCDNDGARDLRIRAFSETETAGEFLLLQETGPGSGEWFAQLPISSRADVAGTLFVAQIGTDIPTVQISYQDIDVLPGAPQEICKNSIDPNAQAEIRVTTLVLLQQGKIVLTATKLKDSLLASGDGDPFADTDETLDIEIVLSNKTGAQVTGLRANLASNDPDVECITDTIIDFGEMAVGEERGSGGDVFTFKVSADAKRTAALGGLAQILTAEFTVSLSSEQFDNTVSPQVITLDLDLDAAGGDTPTIFFEGFEGSFGQFTSMQLDAGHGGSATDGSDNVNSDGFRCQYSNPNWSQSNSYGTGAGQDCYLNPTGLPDTFNWQVLPPGEFSARSFSGIGALYYGINIADNLGLTSMLAQIDAIRTINPFNLGVGICSANASAACSSAADCVGTCDAVGPPDGFCDNAPNIACTVDANCSFGTTCDAVAPSLTFKHQISVIDSRTVNAPNGESADRGTIGLQLADPLTGNPVGDWIKLDPIFNGYDQQGTDGYTNCLFDPIDDGNTEDDFDDPADPLRRLGPSSTCFPEFSFVYLGDTDTPFSAPNVGNASDPPGLCGGASGLGTIPPECQGIGLGTWVESRFNLEQFKGRRLRARFLVTGLKAGAGVDYETLFAPYNPDPGDDGWFIDDFRVEGALVNPATLSPDTKDAEFGTCGAGCSDIVGSLIAEDENGDAIALPISLSVPGQVINLSGLNAIATGGCLSGPLEYKFCRDDNGSGTCNDGDTVLRNFTDNPKLLTAPDVSATYLAEVRCSTDRDNAGCSSTLSLPVAVGCPGGLDTMLANKPGLGSSDVIFSFLTAKVIDVLSADAATSSGIFPYTPAFTNLILKDTLTAAFTDLGAPVAGRYFLAKKNGPPVATFCNAPDWGKAAENRNVLGDP